MLRPEWAQRGGGPRARPTSEWRTVDGLRVHARRSDEQAPAGRLPLVLVHGLVVSSRYLVHAHRYQVRLLGADAPSGRGALSIAG